MNKTINLNRETSKILFVACNRKHSSVFEKYNKGKKVKTNIFVIVCPGVHKI